eukprot:6214200-Pleurochrysis_carterae.AAC.1
MKAPRELRPRRSSKKGCVRLRLAVVVAGRLSLRAALGHLRTEAAARVPACEAEARAGGR